jgi:hypothetical protein
MSGTPYLAIQPLKKTFAQLAAEMSAKGSASIQRVDLSITVNK